MEEFLHRVVVLHGSLASSNYNDCQQEDLRILKIIVFMPSLFSSLHISHFSLENNQVANTCDPVALHVSVLPSSGF